MGNAVDQNGRLFALDGRGRIRWTLRLGAGAPAVVATCAGIIYAGGTNSVTALTLGGKRLWKVATPEISGVAAGAGGEIVGTQTGRLIALSPRGRVRWNINLGSRPVAVAVPTIAPGSEVYVGTVSGGFCAINTRGRILWSRQLNGSVQGAAALRPGGGVYIGSGEPTVRGALTAFTGGAPAVDVPHPTGGVLVARGRGRRDDLLRVRRRQRLRRPSHRPAEVALFDAGGG